ncbi:MAG: DMT family transporter [Candidatus Bipolaricaulia bacterium]
MPGRGILYTRFAIGVVAASFGAILVRYAGEATPLTIAAWRLGLTAIVLLPVALAHKTLRSSSRRELLWSMASGVALAFHFVLWITSLRYTSVASSVLFVTTHPIFVGLGAHFVLRERAGRGLIVGIGLAVFGGVLIGFGDLRIGGDALRGDLLALAGGLAVSIYFLIGRRVRQTMPLIDYITVTYGTAAVLVLASCLIVRSPLGGFSPSTYLFLVLVALIPQLIGHSTFNWALKHLPASKVSVMILGEPIGSTLLAVLFFSEMPTWLNGIGAVIILLGIYLSLTTKEASDGEV